jgi:hypothetical protein
MSVAPSCMPALFKDGFAQVIDPTGWRERDELYLCDSIVFTVEVGLTNWMR